MNYIIYIGAQPSDEGKSQNDEGDSKPLGKAREDEYTYEKRDLPKVLLEK
jgi:hypothetical protein